MRDVAFGDLSGSLRVWAAAAVSGLRGPQLERPDFDSAVYGRQLGLPRIGDQSFDAMAGSILGHFDFTDAPHTQTLMLNPTTGEAVGIHGNQ